MCTRMCMSVYVYKMVNYKVKESRIQSQNPAAKRKMRWEMLTTRPWCKQQSHTGMPGSLLKMYLTPQKFA